MAFQHAAFHTTLCQCRSSVDETEPQAKVKQVHHAALRGQQLTQFLLGLEFGTVPSAGDEETLLHRYVGITWLHTLLHPEYMVVDSPFLLVEAF